jgi:hypothetical protein
MKMEKRIHALSVLLAMLLVSVVVVPAVSAEQFTEKLSPEQSAEISGADPEKDIGVGGMQISRTLSFDNADEGKDIGIGGMEISKISSGILDLTYTWYAGTDIWKEFLGPVKSIHYSRSRTDSGSAFDIYKIGVRGRVWKDGSLKFDQTQTNYYSADAQVNYQSSDTFLSGYWTAQSDHVFEYPANNDYWYPTTTDNLDL